MPTVPKKIAREIAPVSPTPIFQTGAGATPEAFGVSKGVQVLGRALEIIGEQLSAIDEKEKEAESVRRAKRADTELRHQLLRLMHGDDETSGYLELRGANADDASEPTFQTAKDLRTAIADKLGDPRSKELFMAVSDQRLITAGGSIFAHRTTQRKVASVDAAEARRDVAKLQAAAEFTNPTVLANSLDIIAQETAIITSIQGLSKERAVATIVAEQSSLIKAVIGVAARVDLPFARLLFEGNMGKISGTVQKEIDILLDTADAAAVAAADKAEAANLKRIKAEQENNWTLGLVASTLGEIDENEIVRMALNNEIDGSQFKSLLSFHKAENAENDNPDLFNELLGKTLSGGLDVTDLFVYKELLTGSELTSLMNTADQVRRRTPLSFAQTTSLQRIKDTVVGKLEPFATLSPAKQLKLNAATVDFMARIEEGKDSLKVIEEDLIFQYGVTTPDLKTYNLRDEEKPRFWRGLRTGNRETLNKEFAATSARTKEAWDFDHITGAEALQQLKLIQQQMDLIEGISK